VRVLLTGAGGQLGRALVSTAPPGAELRALGRDRLDIADAAAVAAAAGAFRPEIVINAAAYTAVDRAESEPEAARQGNVRGPMLLAEAAAAVGARMIHVSTDFVFNGTQSRAYTPDDEPDPISVYGRTKLEGERAVSEILGEGAVVVRTAWVYSAWGRNFVNTMLRLMREHEEVGVVADQVGTPTAATSLARALWALAAEGCGGVFHWTDAGVASWYDFAVAIAEEGRTAGLLDRPVAVRPITTADYPTPAKRPAFSMLDWRSTAKRTGLTPRHWRENLRDVLQEASSG